MKEEKITFNDALIELEQILKSIEDGDIDLDNLTQQVKRASFLLEICNKKLRNTETELGKITSKIK